MKLSTRTLSKIAPHTRSFLIRRMSAFATVQASAPTSAPSKPTVNGNSNSNANSNSKAQHTITGLKRWSSTEKKRIPSVDAIKSIHVYDFDNTLFASPLPNRLIWNGLTIGSLANPDHFLNGGWWHDVSILAATGEGLEAEEPRAWKGWWNEKIVELVQLSMRQKDVLSVMLTGRSEGAFAQLLLRMLKSRALEFDLVCLKPAVGPGGQKFASTMQFKQEFLRDLVLTYRTAEEIKIYEDRPKHTAAFKTFLEEFNASLAEPNPPRKTITADIIQVTENATQLDPVTEVSIIQRILNEHNLAIRNGTAPKSLRPLQIRRGVLYTGYTIPSSTSEALVRLANTPENTLKDPLNILADSVLITPRPAPRHILEKIGGIGAHMRWRVNGIGCLNGRIWAARVEPVGDKTVYHTDNSTPMVVLALKRGSKPAEANNIQHWKPLSEDQSFEFNTTVGEKVLLRIEEEHDPRVLSWQNGNVPPHKKPRKTINTGNEQEFPALGVEPPKGPAHMTKGGGQGFNSAGRGGGQAGRGRGAFSRGNARGGRGNFRGGQGAGGGRSRGRGGQHSYKSLDDVGNGDTGGGGVYDGY